MNTQQKITLSWLAGIIDGEGTISFSNIGRGHTPCGRVSFFTMSEAIEAKARNILDELGIHYHVSGRKNVSGTSIETINADAVEFLKLLRPYIVRQVERADDIVAFYAGRLPYQRWTEEKLSEWEALRIKHNRVA